MCTITSRRLATSALLVAIAAVHSTALAQAEDQAAARALFDDARALMGAGKYDDACPKLEAAAKLYTSAGILLNLGDCYEHLGRSASAWTEFGEARSVAERLARQDDEAEARRRQAALESKLTRLVVRGPANAPPSIVVKRDGATIERGAWGVAVPVDPGTHTIARLDAGGRASWTQTITLTDPGKTVTVDVPAAESSALANPPPPAVLRAAPPAPGHAASFEPAPAAPRYWTSRRIAGAAGAAVGVVTVGVGGVMGLVAKAQFDTATNESGASRHDDSVAAVGLGNAATALTIAGGVVAAAGLVLWLTAPNARVSVGSNGSSVFLAGRF